MNFGNIITDFFDKITDQDLWIGIGIRCLEIIAIIIVANLLIRIGRVAIENIFKVRARSILRTSDRRDATLKKLLENILAYVVYFIAFIMILAKLGIEIAPLLAGAGIAGLAIGFGAQNLVRDIITGFFIIFEDQFSVGDYVRIGQFEGTVEEIGLRTTKIKGPSGEINIVPNGVISEVTNFSLSNSKAIVDIGIAYEENIAHSEKIIQELLETLPGKYEELVNTPELLGVQTLAPSEVVLRIVAETQPMKHFYIARMLRKEIKNWLDEHGIEIPFPRLVMYSRADEVNMPRETSK